MTHPNPFAARSAENPHGALYRDVTIEVRRAPMAPSADSEGALDVAADVADGVTEAEELQPLEIAISSEAAVERIDWMTGERYLEVLDHSTKGGPDLSYAKDGLPFLMDHDLDDQIGLVESLRVDGDRTLRGVVRQGNHPDAAWVFEDMLHGIRKKVSIGYWPGDVYTQTKGKDGVVTRRYTGWCLYEASSVAVPADYSVGVGRDARGIAKSAQSDPAAGATPHTKESQMQDHTTSERGMSPAPDTRAAELAVLAKEGDAVERLADWMIQGTTVEQARAEVIKALRDKAERAPTINASEAPVSVAVGQDRAEAKPFAAFGEFLRTVRDAELHPHLIDPRLRGLSVRAGTGLGEGVGSEGGFLFPPQYAEGIVARAFQGGKMLSRVRKVPITANRYAVTLVDETSRVSGSRWGGVQSYWVGEGGSPTASKPKFRQQYFDLKKIATLGYVTEEQMEDYSATASILDQAFAEELTFELERTIVEGTGAGQPLGILNSGAVVSVAAEGAQTAGTINIQNIAKMYARLWSRSMATSAWFINQDALPQLPLMTLGNFPIYLAPGQAGNASDFGLLFGRPVIVTEYNSSIGTVGDIILADLDQYMVAERSGVQMQQSMHVRFVQGEQAFRTIYRVDGAPLWNAPLTPLKGSNTQSPFITLAAR